MRARPSPIAGTWYPGTPAVLTGDIERFLAEVEPHPLGGKLWGVVAPHAGYTYSGAVAAYAFKQFEGLKPGSVVIVSPLHASHPAPLLTTAYDAYQTPLGTVEVDKAALNALDRTLRARIGVGLIPLEEDAEHSLEIELPFLQHLLGTFSLVPVMIRDQRVEVAQALGRALAEILGERQPLFVASTDLSHFYAEERARELDREMLERIEHFDPAAVIAAETEGVGFACGRGAVSAVLWATRSLGADRETLLRHDTSGSVSGDFTSVVGYGAAAIWQEDQRSE
ncbi:MAG: AmmeMemoRadiSam system protein B [Trueperaceae bacterium]|nr:MAG: AmmeMemoRadiSam system protein B [Trueperaceae bacterium]